MIIEKNIKNEDYIMCETIDDFEEFCHEAGWEDSEEFYNDTGVSFEDVEGKFFFICGRPNQVFIEEEKKLWIEEYKDGD